MPAFQLPDEPLEKLIKRAIKDFENYQAFSQLCGRTQLEISLGAAFNRLMHDPIATAKALNDPDRNMRIGALWLIENHWPPNKTFIPGCANAAFYDAESLIRGGGLSALWRLYEITDDSTGILGEFLRRMGYPTLPTIKPSQSHMLIKKASDSSKDWQDSRWQKGAGPLLANMRESQIVAESYVDDPSPQLRSTAIEIILFYWKAPGAIVKRCEELACNDPDMDVREAAFACISDIYKNSNDKRIGKLFASLVSDESLPIKLRRSAYLNLTTITGWPREKRINIVRPGFKFPEDVDWSFVQSYMNVAKGE